MPPVGLRDGATLHVDVCGSGRDTVLVSGLGGLGGFWQPLVDALGPGFRTVRFDQRGLGRSARGRQAVTVKALAVDTWEIVDALGLDRPVLCGHSTGGAIVQEMALLRPGVASGLVLSGSWAGPDWFMQRMFGLRLELLARSPALYNEFSALIASPPRWLNDNPDVVERAGGRVPEAGEVSVIRERIEALLAHDCRERLAGISAPTLVLGAEDDLIVPVYLQEELATMLQVADLHVFDKGGHFFPVTRPDDVAARMRPWLSGAEALNS